MTTARDIAHRYARKAHMCPYNKHSDRHQEHSAFCDALGTDIEAHASGLVNLTIDNYKESQQNYYGARGSSAEDD